MLKIKKAISLLVEQRKDEFIAISEELYRQPETGNLEFRASALLADFLEKEGFHLERGIAGLETAFCASYGTAGPCIAILAEMDALPELGHACGHNIIAAAAVGAAIALRHTLSPLVARVMLVGTPAEELGIGKVDLVRSGFFMDVDFAMMVHPSSKRYVVKQYLGLAKISFIFYGRVSHAAAYPEEGINALDAVIQTFNGVNALRQQVRQDVRMHGIITDGGAAPNIIPGKASCYFYVRAGDLAELDRVVERVIACADGAAKATGCRLEVDPDDRVLAPFKLNGVFSDLYSAQLRYLGLQEAATSIDRNRGSSDIGNVSQVVPTIHPHVPIGAGLHIHSEEFARATVANAGRLAVLEGAVAMALTAAELAESAELRREIVEAFRS